MDEKLQLLEEAAEGARVARDRLIEAANEVADRLIALAKQAKVDRVGNWQVEWVRSNNVGASCAYLVSPSNYENWYVGSSARGGYLCGDFNCPLPEATRDAALAFAKDIEAGLLDKFLAQLREVEARNTQAEETLRQAHAKLPRWH